jgi:hypothetical protein
MTATTSSHVYIPTSELNNVNPLIERVPDVAGNVAAHWLGHLVKNKMHLY